MKKPLLTLATAVLGATLALPGAGIAHDTPATPVGDYYLIANSAEIVVWQETNDQPNLQTHEHDGVPADDDVLYLY